MFMEKLEKYSKAERMIFLLAAGIFLTAMINLSVSEADIVSHNRSELTELTTSRTCRPEIFPVTNSRERRADPAQKCPATVRVPLKIPPITEWTFHKSPDGVHPDGREQQMVWLMNRARANPAAEGVWLANLNDPDVVFAITKLNVDIELMKNEFAAIPPKPPAAFDIRLYNAAYEHCKYMISCNCQSHTGQNTEVKNAGFEFSLLKGNIFSNASSAIHCHAALNIDWIIPHQYNDGSGMQPGRGHRVAIMSINRNLSNVGIAIKPHDGTYPDNVGPLVMTGNYAAPFISNYTGLPPDHYNRFILGTVWTDADLDGMYDPGEGIGGVTVMPDHGIYYAVTGQSGGYSIPIIKAGTYRIIFSGAPLPESGVSKIIPVGDNSVLMDVNTAEAIDAEFNVDSTSGPAPLAVTFIDQSTGILTGWHWDFGDGSTSSLQFATHTFTSPGNYTVSFIATGSTDSDIEIKTGYIRVALPGADLDGNGKIDLNDLILALKIITLQASSAIQRNNHYDINGDGKVGMEEVIYILKWISHG